MRLTRIPRLVAAGALALGLSVATGGSALAQKLVVWGSDRMGDPKVAELWEEIASRFEAANPGVTVEYMHPTGTISDGAVQAAIQSSAGPDVLVVSSGVGRVSIVANAGLVKPLTSYYESEGWKDQIYPWLYELLTTQFNGEIYDVPESLEAIGLWYHKDLFEENGWSLNGSWADFEATLEAIKATGLEPIAVGIRGCCNSGHLFGNYLQAAAGRDVMGDVVAGRIPWTDERVVLGAQRLVDAVDAGYISKQMLALDQDGAFRVWANKRAAILFAGPWFVDTVRSLGYDISNMGYATIPSDIEGASLPTGGVNSSWLIPTSSKQRSSR